MSHPVVRAEGHIWLTARLLEQRRFAHHFRTPDPDGVEAALRGYQRPDGGFGFALEPDLRGPGPQPLHAAFALRVLDEIGRCDETRTAGLLRHFEAISAPDGALPAIHPSLRGYPSASVLPLRDDPPGALLSTGPVVGLLLRNGIRHPWVERAAEFCWAAAGALDATHPYEVEAAVDFLDGVPDRDRALPVALRLGDMTRGRRMYVTDPERAEEFPVPPGYAPGEHHFPYDVAHSPASLARQWFTGREMEDCLDFLAARQEEDGGWPILWRAWAPGSRLEWRPVVTLAALRTLRAYGRL
ncbi:hypothetical protein ACH427_12215 [Streptomyces sp. NPDC020379]|uniref:hypothetical protein n=1 Tax=Streptomyces sp. NPDC020379 TaxID=3365071 RepID=UPI00378743FE